MNFSKFTTVRRIIGALSALLLCNQAAHAQFGMAEAPKDILTARAITPRGGFNPGSNPTLEVQLTVKEPFHVNANPATEDFLIPTQIVVKSAPGLTVGKAIYPAATLKKFTFFEKKLAVYQGTVVVRVPLKLAPNFKGGLSGTVKYQACSDKACLPPATAKWSLGAGTSASTSGAITPKTGLAGTTDTASLDAQANQLRQQFGVAGLPSIVFLDASGQQRRDLRAGEELTLAGMTQKLDALHSGQQLETDAASAGGWLGRLQKAPLWAQLALVFVGGLLLNLTPCVYPMIPITIGYFGSQSGGSSSRTFSLALFYVLGLSLVYSALGVSAALTGNLFGSTLQSPLAIGFVAIVLFALSLSMMGVFTINPPQALMAHSGAKKGIWGALAMGALLGIVAAPCVGPVVAALLTYVGARANVALGFGLFFALSLGLGMPYLLLGTFSGAIKSLPRSGAWLEKSKKFFAVPLLLASFYYAYLAVQPAFAHNETPVTQIADAHWQPATLAAVEAAKAAGQPVVLDFRADWCLPCLKMEREIFHEKQTLEAAEKNGVRLLRVDLTRASS